MYNSVNNNWYKEHKANKNVRSMKRTFADTVIYF